MVGHTQFCVCGLGLQLLGPNGPPGREAGFLYGLGLATDRLGNTEEALPMLYKALDGYRKERIDPEGNPVDSSIHAKVCFLIVAAQTFPLAAAAALANSPAYTLSDPPVVSLAAVEGCCALMQWQRL